MSRRDTKQSNFLIQGSILAMAGILVRMIGMLYRMPLNDIIGKEGNGYYTSAYNVYNILLILSSYSMPVAISKMISARLANGQYRSVGRILKTGLLYATVAGGIAGAALWFGADFFAQAIRTPFSRYALQTLAPTIWVMAYLGVLRGYFQGTGTMVPTAISQILEQIVNAVVSVVAASLLFKAGQAITASGGSEAFPHALGAAGGTMGTGAGALTALIFFVCLTLAKGRRLYAGKEDVTGEPESYGRLLFVMTATVVPIVASSAIYNCSNIVDNTLFGQGMDALGFGASQIAVYWGALGQYQLLFNIPVAVSNALSSSLIVSLAAAVSRGDREQTISRIDSGIRFSLLIALPAAVGITVLAGPICNLLFVSEDNSLLIRLTMVGALAVVFYSLSTVTNAILQGLNRMDLPIRHSAISLVIHVAVLEALLMGARFGIFSVVIANICFAFIMCTLNALSITKLCGYRQKYGREVALPLAAALIMGVIARAAYGILIFLSPFGPAAGRLRMALYLFPSIAVAAAVYAVLLVRLGALSEAELAAMPQGMRLVRLFKKARLM